MKPLLVLAALLSTAPLHAAIAPGAVIAAAPSHYAKLGGARIHYKVAGRGRTTLVFVHGWGGDMNVWREQAAAFAPKARLVLIDLPGHGASDKPELAYTIEHFARAVKAVMDDAHVERAVLVGHSMGTPVIREVDRLFPTRVRGLVAVDGALKNFFDDPAAVKKFVAPLRADDGSAVAAKRIAGMMPTASAALRDEVASAAASTPHHVLASAMENMFDAAAWSDEQITIPLLVLNAKSPVWTAEYEAFVKQLAPKLDYQLIDGVDHFLMLEAPAEFNRRLGNWLKANDWIR